MMWITSPTVMYHAHRNVGPFAEFKLSKSVVISIVLYGCETWTLLADFEKRIHAFETEYVRKLLHIFYLEHKTNNWVQSRVNSLVSPQEPLLATVKRRKLAWFRHVICYDNLSKLYFRAPWRVGNTLVGRGYAG